MKTKPEKYKVEFHFPYASVTSDAVDESMVNLYSSYMHVGNTFEVRTEYRAYLINPSMVTYMEVSADVPF